MGTAGAGRVAPPGAPDTWAADVDELAAAVPHAEREAGDRDGSGDRGAHRGASPDAARQRETQQEQQGRAGGGVDEGLGRLLVSLDDALGHDSLDDLLVSLSGLHGHEAAADEQDLQPEDGAPSPSGQLALVDGDGDSERDQRHEQTEREGQVDDGGVKGDRAHGGTSSFEIRATCPSWSPSP